MNCVHAYSNTVHNYSTVLTIKRDLFRHTHTHSSLMSINFIHHKQSHTHLRAYVSTNPQCVSNICAYLIRIVMKLGSLPIPATPTWRSFPLAFCGQFIHAHMNTSVNTYVHACIPETAGGTSAYRHTCTHTHMYACICTCMYAYLKRLTGLLYTDILGSTHERSHSCPMSKLSFGVLARGPHNTILR